MRITIDKHGNTYAGRRDSVSGKPARLWLVHPASFRELPRGADEGFGYHLEIRNDIGGPGEEQITCVVGNEVGEMSAVLPLADFEKYADTIMEHEDWTREEAYAHLNENLHVISIRELRALGGDPTIFDALIEAWKAVNHFVDFGITF